MYWRHAVEYSSDNFESLLIPSGHVFEHLSCARNDARRWE